MIEKLLKKGICFAIIKSYSNLKKSKNYQNSQWEIIASGKDFGRLAKFGFELNENEGLPLWQMVPDNLLSKRMYGKHIREFQRLLPIRFTKVLETEFGIVYEISNNSFREEYSKQIK